MSLLEELNILVSSMGIQVETGVFSDPPPDTYVVLTPLVDTFPLCADNVPVIDQQEVRISLFTKANPRAVRNQIICALVNAGITITDRVFVEHENDTGFFHHAIDSAKENMWEGC
jgi:hypothetical protein